MPLTKTQIRHATPSRPAWGFFVFKTRSNSNVNYGAKPRKIIVSD